MDRNSVIGLLLIGAIMVVFTYMNKPEAELIKPNTEKVDSLSAQKVAQPSQNLSVNNLPSANDSLLKQAQFGSFANATNPINETSLLENNLLKIEFASKGGVPSKVTLKNYYTWEKQDLTLFDNQTLNLKIPYQNRVIETSNLYFKSQPSSNGSLKLLAEGSNGDRIEYIWTLKEETFQVDWEAKIQTANNLKFEKLSWKQQSGRKEKNVSNERDNSTVYYKTDEGEVDKLNPIGSDSLLTETSTEWLAFKQQFFSTVLIPEKGFSKNVLISSNSSTDEKGNKNYKAEGGFSAAASNMKFKLYFGPNHFQTLKETGYDLQMLIPLGWGIFGWVNKFLVIPVFSWLDGYALNYGIVILLLTLIIKLLLLPFQFRSYMSQAKMRVLKPELDELNKKYENEDPLKKQQAVMNLYREAGVNPLGGCLPLLLQLPILLAMFNFFPNAIELRQKSFLWADDLSTYDSILNLPFDIPVYGDHVSLFALLMTISTIIYTMMNNQLSGANSQMPQLKWMMYLMPVIFLFVLNSYASGLNYYYFLANIITFGQQFAFMKMVDEDKIHKKIQANKLKPASQKASSFQQKLEEMAKKRGINPPNK
jgi:YidC/Oxa1 family membrane protein insertase